MKLTKLYIKPSYSRKPFYDGDSSKGYEFTCPLCQTVNEIPFRKLLSSAWGWKESYSEFEVKQIKSHFGIGVVGKPHDGGWPSFNLVTCSGCTNSFISYIGFYEYRNSVYRLTEQGLASVKT